MSTPEPALRPVDPALRPVDPARSRALIRELAGLPVVILGDVMLDHFIFGRVTRISPEAPVPVVEFDREEFRAGGAANVAHNVRGLGGLVEIVGLVGRDDHGTRVKDALRADGIGTAGIVVDDSRPTTRKMRVVTSRNQQVARIDYETDHEARGDVEAALMAALDKAAGTATAVVVSDYLKGSITRPLVARAVSIARDRRIPVLVDPKIAHLDYYSGVTLVTPNNAEAETAAHTRIRTHADARDAARAIRERLGCQGVLITRGEAGMWLFDDRNEGHLPAAAREVADVTGAGDTVIATLALALAAGADIVEAATLANAAAGISVSKFGPAGVTPEELRGQF
jgi:D-beta-D-heptose 7-phosphate kinase/D-beta-D-heptose 1-phosphate adenosyltransferase